MQRQEKVQTRPSIDQQRRRALNGHGAKRQFVLSVCSGRDGDWV
jgi:hypothetical protein